MAEFFRNYLKDCSAEITPWRCWRSSSTDCRASPLDAEVNNEPAYRPAAVSAMAGGLCPVVKTEGTWY